MVAGTQGEAGRLVSLTIKGVTLVSIYAIYGVLQERIMKGSYKSPSPTATETTNLKFTSAPLLVLCNRLVSLLTGLLLAVFRKDIEETTLPIPGSSPSHQPSSRLLFLGRIKPASPLLYYALVASLNNAATLSQYTSLAYLTFTTATLGKCAKMVPVLILGYVVYGKRYQRREWVGVILVVAGIWGYLISIPTPAMTDEEHRKAIATNWMGITCLLAYLFFDGLTSTTQERVFGKSKGGKPLLFGLTRPVMDQMIWVNFFSSLIALQMLFFSPSSGTVPSIKLAMTSPVLQFHILMLSLTATCGLILLFHVIASEGALIAGLIMTLRQFVSVVCNAVWFGNMEDISPIGWASIGFVAAGVWIKMNRRYDTTPIEKEGASTNPAALPQRKGPFWIRQYVIPIVVCPFTFVFLTSTLTFVTNIGHRTNRSSMGGFLTATSVLETSRTHPSESGNYWDDLLVSAVDPECPAGPLNSVKYDTNTSTALATYPRSGSSYTRALIERATGYLTSSIYCDNGFDEFFLAECDGYNTSWTVKTHFPSELKHANDHDIHWKHFDRYLQIVRNPIDVLWSVRNLLSTHDHSKKLENVKFTKDSHHHLLPHLQDWNEFLNYWADVPIQGMVIRYEDLRRTPSIHIGQIVDYLLPEADQPSPERIACALKLDHEKEMYLSPKILPFQKWEDHFTEETFTWIIEQVAENWCKWGYDRLLFETRGTLGPVNCKGLNNYERIPIDFTDLAL